MKNKFYIMKINGSAPTRAHDSYDEAREEAERLAIKHQGDKFMILSHFSTVKAKPVSVTEEFTETHF